MQVVFDAVLLHRGDERLRPEIAEVARRAAEFERDEMIDLVGGMALPGGIDRTAMTALQTVSIVGFVSEATPKVPARPDAARVARAADAREIFAYDRAGRKGDDRLVMRIGARRRQSRYAKHDDRCDRGKRAQQRRFR